MLSIKQSALLLSLASSFSSSICYELTRTCAKTAQTLSVRFSPSGTNLMEQSLPSGGNRRNFFTKIPRFLWNPRVHYHANKMKLSCGEFNAYTDLKIIFTTSHLSLLYAARTSDHLTLTSFSTLPSTFLTCKNKLFQIQGVLMKCMPFCCNSAHEPKDRGIKTECI